MKDQADLFDDKPATPPAVPSPPPKDGARHIVAVPGPAAALSKAQREFNRLSQRIARLREQLAEWHAATALFQQRAASELQPLSAKLVLLQRETVLWIDGYLAQPPAGERLPKKLRAKLVAMLRLLADAVLQSGPDDDVEAAHDRHSPLSRQDEQRAQAELAAALFGEATGDKHLFEGEAASVDELMDRAAQRLREQAERDAAETPASANPEPPPGRRPSREEKARARDAQALQEASQSVREVYRRLASSLHPDREPDADARVRKTALMARVNEAYGRNDLLTLLSVQFEIEQIDAARLAGLPDERLRHFSRVLKEQQQVLEQELGLLQAPVAAHFGGLGGFRGAGALLLARVLDENIADLRMTIGHLRRDAEALRDARSRGDFLRAIEIDDPEDSLSPFEELMFMQSLHEGAVRAPATRAKPKRRR